MMKYPFLILLVWLLPVMCMAQGMKEYRQVIAQVVQCYNSTDAATLSTLFSDRSPDKGRYTRRKLDNLKFELAAIVHHKYMRQREDRVAIFKVKFAKHTGKYTSQLYQERIGYIGLILDKHNKIYRLLMPTSFSLNNEPKYFFRENKKLSYSE